MFVIKKPQAILFFCGVFVVPLKSHLVPYQHRNTSFINGDRTIKTGFFTSIILLVAKCAITYLSSKAGKEVSTSSLTLRI